LIMRHSETDSRRLLQPYGKKRPRSGRIHFSVLFARDGPEVSCVSVWGMYECEGVLFGFSALRFGETLAVKDANHF